MLGALQSTFQEPAFLWQGGDALSLNGNLMYLRLGVRLGVDLRTEDAKKRRYVCIQKRLEYVLRI